MATLRKLLPTRSKDSNKAKAGRSLIIGGSTGMWGAAILAAKAAARVGSGYVQILTDTHHFPSEKYPDFLLAEMKSAKLSKLTFSALAIGPGLGQSLHAQKILTQVLKLKTPNIVFDADALNLLAKKKSLKLKSTWVLTPHEGELARLLGCAAREIRENRKKAILKAQKKFGCIVVLKGHETLIADGSKVLKNKTGNAALAKSGTGDVLTGMICGFMAQGLDSLSASRLAVHLHGKIADNWIKNQDVVSLIASDLIELIPTTLKQLRKGQS